MTTQAKLSPKPAQIEALLRGDREPLMWLVQESLQEGEDIQQWRGDSRAHWDGNTLVVDTANFSHETWMRGSSPNMHLVERFSRVDADTLLYEFTLEDPTTWASPWTAQVSMRKTEDLIFEYACHEGNIGLYNILAVARAEEKAAAAATNPGSR